MRKLTLYLVCCQFAWLAALAPRPAAAIEYEVYIDIEQEEDLFDLEAAGYA